MAEIIHDPTRGWLLLTEKWPEQKEGHFYTQGWDIPNIKAHCLSTAIEIAKEDWGEIIMAVKIREVGLGNEEWPIQIQDHHPYSVDAEFEVVKQRNCGGCYCDERFVDSEGWYNPYEDGVPQFDSCGECKERKIARLAKPETYKGEPQDELLVFGRWLMENTYFNPMDTGEDLEDVIARFRIWMEISMNPECTKDSSD